MEKQSLKNSAKLLALDISTKTIGVALFELKDMKLLELFHVQPKIVPLCENKTQELLLKADIFKKRLLEYQNMGLVHVVIESPLINSNNVYTVQTLLRFNSFVTKCIFDIFGIVPEFISTYDARKYAFPDLVQENDKGKKVLFGGLPRDIDKKQIIWEQVAKREPGIKWLYNKNGILKKESWDMSDAYTCGIGYFNRNNLNK